MSEKPKKIEDFESLILEYRLIIYKVCFMYATKYLPIEDLYQETIVNIWKGQDQFKNQSKQSTWIYRIAINSCISFSRKEKRYLNPYPITTDLEDLLQDVDAEKKQMIHRMYELIEQLGNLDKSIILLYLENFNYDDIAEVTGLTRSNVGSKINRIKEKLCNMNKKTAY